MDGCSRVVVALDPNEHDRLRARVLELETQVQALRKRQVELQDELSVASRGPDSLPEDVRLCVPHVAGIAIDRLSHARDSDGDGRADLLMLYVRPTDGLGRFTQMVGWVRGSAVLMPTSGEAITIGRVSVGPADLRQAYRSTFLGVHYTIPMPIDPPTGREGDSCAVVVSFEDALSGRTHTAEATIRISRPTAPVTHAADGR
jgi:hypothetical protein